MQKHDMQQVTGEKADEKGEGDQSESLSDSDIHIDKVIEDVSLPPIVSNLVNSYMSGISSLTRALLYFFIIMYISCYPDLQSTNYLANAKNPLNQYFVKFSWGWTFSAVFLFMILSNFITTGSWLSNRTLKSSCRLAVGTIVWYVFARIIFPYIEEATGVCEVSGLLTKRSCYLAGHFWRGFDTSGHCFLLSWNNLFMVEESQQFFQQKKTKLIATEPQATNQSQENVKFQDSLQPYLEYLSCGLALLMLLGEIMMLCTSMYFHTFLEKFFGTICGLGSWYLMYKKVYQGAWHPYSLELEKQE